MQTAFIVELYKIEILKNIYCNLLFERSEDAILIIKDGKFIDCNNATVKMLRYKNKKELLDTHPSELSPEFQPDGRLSFEKADEMMRIAFEKGTHRFEWEHKKADGEVFSVEVLLTDVSQDSNEKTLNTVWRDVTDRKKSERMQNALYRISESTYTVSDMKALYKKIHKIISELIPVKNIYIALYDEESEILTFPYFVDEYDPPQPPKKLGKGLTEYVLRTGEACLADEKKDLELRTLDEVDLIGAPTKIWLGVPLKISGKSIGVIVVQDYNDENAYGEDEKQLLIFVSEQIAQVIERKQNSVRLKKYAEELKEANKTKDKFFSIIAHDLKSPFQGLLGYSQILMNEYATITEKERISFINSIDEISKNAFLLLEDLLTWSRLQTGKMEIKFENFNLSECLYRTISLLKQTALNKEIKINCFIDNNIYVNADKNMVCTIVRNIISNAIKFTNCCGEITISSKPVENLIEISIVDTGVGIKKENLEKLFTIDKNVSTKGTANEEGTGLGLLLCKEMIEKQGGKIWVESEPGKGSNFIFTIPVLN
ncbi:MAG TPA: PAS domain S-box protein [Ignavibacteria bacterium]|nr:PAS domain S-box protein [Ignavibacteria bacterium]